MARGRHTIPGAETLTMVQVLAALGISESGLNKLIREGRFPRGVKSSPQSQPIWPTAALASWLYLRPMMMAGTDAEGEAEAVEPKERRQKDQS